MPFMNYVSVLIIFSERLIWADSNEGWLFYWWNSNWKKMKRNIRIILLCNLDGTEKNDYFFFICNGVRFHCHWLASSNSMFCIYKYASALWGVAWIWTVKALEEYRFVQFSWNCVWYLPSEVLKNWGKWIISNNYRHSRVKRVLTNSIYRHCQLNST